MIFCLVDARASRLRQAVATPVRQVLGVFATKKCVGLADVVEMCAGKGQPSSNPQIRLTAVHWLLDSLDGADAPLETKQLAPLEAWGLAFCGAKHQRPSTLPPGPAWRRRLPLLTA